MGQKLLLWEDIMTLRIFTEKHSSYDWAWELLDDLMKNDCITQIDVMHIRALLDIAIDYRNE